MQTSALLGSSTIQGTIAQSWSCLSLHRTGLKERASWQLSSELTRCKLQFELKLCATSEAKRVVPLSFLKKAALQKCFVPNSKLNRDSDHCLVCYALYAWQQSDALLRESMQCLKRNSQYQAACLQCTDRAWQAYLEEWPGTRAAKKSTPNSKTSTKDAEELGVAVPKGDEHAEYYPWLLRADLSPEEVRLPLTLILALNDIQKRQNRKPF